jgi:phage N-6-adenine-methyltransferase
MSTMTNILDDLLGGAPPKPSTIELSQLRIDGGTQMRAGLNDATVQEYMEAMRNFGGYGPFPPIVVYYDGTDHWVGDGFHRAAAATRSQLSAIPADIRPGTRRDAILFAAGANASHGLRRSQADKRRGVETLLRDEEWRNWADREIARRCNVSADLVGQVRRELYPPAAPPPAVPPVTVGNDSEPAPWVPPGLGAQPRTFVTKHGTPATMQTANIGKTQPSYVASWRIEVAVRCVCERDTPLAAATQAHADGLREAARTPGSAFMREVEAILDEDDLEYRRQDIVQAMHNVARQIEQNCKSLAAPALAVPIKLAARDEASAILTPDRAGPDDLPVSQRDGYDGDEWYTPADIIRTAAGVMLRIDTDPATCELAQTAVQAGTYYTKFDDGLTQPWHGAVWLNPPYSTPQVWIDKLFCELLSSRCTQAIVLVNNATETAWFQRLLAEAKLVCFPSRRLAFWRHDHSNVGARQGQALFYFGSRAEVFHGAFSNIGVVLRRSK